MGTPATRVLSYRREIALWLVAAFAVRLAFYLLTPHVIDSADSILYLDAAQSMADGRFAEVYPRIPLLYSALAAVVSFAAPDVESASTAVSLVAGALLVAPVFALSRAMHGLAAARISALTVTLWPWLVDYSCRAAPEALYTTLWFASILAAMHAARRGGAACVALAAALIGVYLARPEGIAIAAAVLFAAIATSCERGRAARRLAPAFAALLVVVPLHLWVTHKLSETTGVPPRFSASSAPFAFAARGADAARTAAHLLGLTLPVMLGPVLGAFAVAGIAARGTRLRDRRIELLVTCVAAAQVAAAAFSTFPEPRYVMPVTIAIALWSACGAAVLAERAAASARWHSLRYGPATLVAAMMLVGMGPNVVPPMLGHKSYKPLEYKIAGQWMKANLEPGMVLSRKPQVGYYANMPTSGPAPKDTLDDIRKRAFDANMRYLVVDERYSTTMVPALGPLLDPRNAPPWLRVLKADLSPYADARIVIYEIVKDAPAP